MRWVLVCKGKEIFDLSVPHEKIYIRRPLLDQWKSYATARLLKKFQWEDGDEAQTDDVCAMLTRRKLN